MKTFFETPFFDAPGDARREAPRPGMAIISTSSDRVEDVGRHLTPDAIDRVMSAANQGDIADLMKLSSEIEERNHVVGHALGTRAAAVQKVPWKIAPADQSAKAKAIAEELEAQLKAAGSRRIKGKLLDTLRHLIGNMAASALSGLHVSEIIWGEGGSLEAFKMIRGSGLRFNTANGDFDILNLITEGGDVAIPADKALEFRRRSPSGDPARAGLIRAIAWLHCFQNLNIKDLLGFIERYGMPFLVAKVDNATWEKERNAIKRLIRNFGSSGGALFSLNTEFQLLQASNNVGEVYFRLLEYVDDAIEKLVLGQIKTSSDTGGLSGGDAQTEVREDIRDADCVEIADAINAQLVAPWMAFNYPSAPLPRFEFDIKPKRDLKELSETLANLKNAGLEADPDEMSAVFGFALTRVAPLALPAAALSLAAESTRAPAMPEAPRSPLVANAYREALGSAWLDGLIDEIDAALSDESGEKLKTLGRPGDLARVDSQALASTLERTIYAAAANGMAAKAEELDLKARKRGAKAQGGLDA